MELLVYTQQHSDKSDFCYLLNGHDMIGAAELSSVALQIGWGPFL